MCVSDIEKAVLVNALTREKERLMKLRGNFEIGTVSREQLEKKIETAHCLLERYK